jgi:hypothetical protein
MFHMKRRLRRSRAKEAEVPGGGPEVEQNQRNKNSQAELLLCAHLEVDWSGVAAC